MELKALKIGQICQNFGQKVKILEIREDLDGVIVQELGKRTKWLASVSNLSHLEK